MRLTRSNIKTLVVVGVLLAIGATSIVMSTDPTHAEAAGVDTTNAKRCQQARDEALAIGIVLPPIIVIGVVIGPGGKTKTVTTTRTVTGTVTSTKTVTTTTTVTQSSMMSSSSQQTQTQTQTQSQTQSSAMSTNAATAVDKALAKVKAACGEQ